MIMQSLIHGQNWNESLFPRVNGLTKILEDEIMSLELNFYESLDSFTADDTCIFIEFMNMALLCEHGLGGAGRRWH